MAYPAIEERTEIASMTLIIPGIVYFLWRAWYFSEWLPLPFLVKSSGRRDLLICYYESLDFILVVLFPIALAVIASGSSRIARRAACALILPIIFYGAMRLEQNIGNRFMAPMFFGGFYLLSQDRLMRPLLVFLCSSIYLSLSMTKGTLVGIANSRFENVFYISRDLAEFKGRMLVTEAGRLPYYSHWIAHDSWGLNTPRFAHKPISVDDFKEDYAYDLIVGHCDLTLLDEDITPPIDQRARLEQSMQGACCPHEARELPDIPGSIHKARWAVDYPAIERNS